ncbi:hypothetical protein [Vibrio proteolyticus]
MKHALWILSSVILVGTLLIVLAINYSESEVLALPSNLLDPLTINSQAELVDFRIQIKKIESDVRGVRSLVSIVLDQKTPVPSSNVFPQSFVSAAKETDSSRELELTEVIDRLNQVGTQLVDLSLRATNMDIKIHDEVRQIKDRISVVESSPSNKKEPLQLIVVLGGLLCSLSTTVLAWRKDAREKKGD